jgi:hypothetical protein
MHISEPSDADLVRRQQLDARQGAGSVNADALNANREIYDDVDGDRSYDAADPDLTILELRRFVGEGNDRKEIHIDSMEIQSGDSFVIHVGSHVKAEGLAGLASQLGHSLGSHGRVIVHEQRVAGESPAERERQRLVDLDADRKRNRQNELEAEARRSGGTVTEHGVVNPKHDAVTDAANTPGRPDSGSVKPSTADQSQVDDAQGSGPHVDASGTVVGGGDLGKGSVTMPKGVDKP